ncbi:MAG: diguanylate cyclase [Clostridia bacterium]|nr:diguanylate cyclase [Clostridia bacterium]
MNLNGKTLSNRYIFKDLIGEGGMSKVWLAEDTVQKVDVAVKILKKNVTSSRVDDKIRFRNESMTVSRLNIPSIAKVIEIGEDGDDSFIVMEYIKGKSLFKLLEEGKEFSLDETLEISIKIAEALKHIHNANIVHRDLKPGNIIIDYATNENERFDLKLIDFGLAQVKEFNEKDTNELIGTLSYMSPEQSGIIKRNIDERSDLYALGIMIYQLLTKKLPFEASHVNSIIHQQIAKVPDNPSKINPSIPVILDKLVIKLLEKEPERRYQSALGLISDLEKVRNGVTDFVLGLDDKIVKLNYRTQLIGREEELEKLKLIYQNASIENGNICFINGEAGQGKTRLVEEFRNYIESENGVFIDAKCFSGNNKIPFGPFKDVLDIYIKQFEKYPIEKKQQIKDDMTASMGHLGEIILKLNSSTKELLGDCPSLVELEADRENIRFLNVSARFFYHLSKIHKPLVIVLDDLQWCDNRSFELLIELIKEIEKYPLLMIATYRENEIPSKHPFYELKEAASDFSYSLNEITLFPFDEVRMTHFISSLLFDNEENSREIAGFIYLKSKGNPYFAIEILKQLIDEKAVVRLNKKWELKPEVLTNIQITSTIVDILIKKISLLNTNEVNILSYAAVMGKKLDIEFLFKLEEFSKEEIVQVIDKALRLQLLEEDLWERGIVYFVHDRIKEIFYKNIGSKNNKELHCKVANIIELINAKNTDKVIFELAYHYIEGKNNEKALEYAYPAALKAMSSYAYEDAVKYLSITIELLEKKGAGGKAQWIECKEYIGSIYLTIGKTNEAINLFNELLPLTGTRQKKLNTYKQISFAYYKQADWKNCEVFCKLGLHVYNEIIPTGKRQFLLSTVKQLFDRGLHNLFPSLFLYNKLKTPSEESRSLAWLYYILSWTYQLSGDYRATYTILKLINFSEKKLGRSKELGLGLMTFAVFLAEIPFSKLALYNHHKTLNLRKELCDEWGIAQCWCNLGFYYKCRGQFRKSIECFNDSITIFTKIGDIYELGAAISGLSGTYFNIADYENSRVTIDKFHENGIKSKNTFAVIYSLITYAMIDTETGDFPNAEKNGVKAYKMSCDENNAYLTCITSTMVGRLYLEMGDTQKSIEYLEIAHDLYNNNRFLKEYTSPLFPFLAEAYIRYYEENSFLFTNKTEKDYLNKIRRTCKEALKLTRVWVNYHMCSLRTQALYYSLRSQVRSAEKYFKESIECAKVMERKFELGLAHKDYAAFLERSGKKSAARKNLETAYTIFRSIGAKSYEKKVGSQLGIQDIDFNSMERFSKELRYSQRLNSIFSLTQDITSTLDLDELLEKIMSIAIEVTGAQRGYLMIKDENTGNLDLKVRKNINLTEIGADGFSKNIMEEVLENHSSIIITNAMEDEKFKSFQSVCMNELKSILCIPIKYKDEFQGICYLDNPLSSGVFSDEDYSILNSIMTQAAISIENAKLYKLAITDGLTGLIIHRHFKNLLKHEIVRSKRYNRIFSLIMFDIDHFKKLNDTYGHPAGDEVLINIARLTKENFRTIDVTARYGGEEFIVILPETDTDGARIAAERLRQDIENSVFTYAEHKIKSTVSMGIASYPKDAETMEELIKKADEALYASKANGRNRITLAGINHALKESN